MSSLYVSMAIIIPKTYYSVHYIQLNYVLHLGYHDLKDYTLCPTDIVSNNNF